MSKLIFVFANRPNSALVVKGNWKAKQPKPGKKKKKHGLGSNWQMHSHSWAIGGPDKSPEQIISD